MKFSSYLDWLNSRIFVWKFYFGSQWVFFWHSNLIYIYNNSRFRVKKISRLITFCSSLLDISCGSHLMQAAVNLESPLHTDILQNCHICIYFCVRICPTNEWLFASELNDQLPNPIATFRCAPRACRIRYVCHQYLSISLSLDQWRAWYSEDQEGWGEGGGQCKPNVKSC